MKKIILSISIMLLIASSVSASYDYTLTDSTPSRVVVYSGSGWISSASLLSYDTVSITLYDTNTTAAATTSTGEPILIGGNYTTDTEMITHNFNPGSYIYFKNGIQMTASGYCGFIRINIREENGAGGKGITVDDTTTSRWLAFSGSGWISDIGVVSIDTGSLTITIYDTNTTTAMTGQSIFENYYNDPVTGDTNVLHIYSLPSGSYIYCRYGAQVTTSDKARFIWINKRDDNGAQ